MLENHDSMKNRGFRIICIGIFSIVFSLSVYSLWSTDQSLSNATKLYNMAVAVFILIMVSLIAIGYGTFLVLRSECLRPQPKKSHLGYISRILTQNTYWRIFVASSIIYGIFLDSYLRFLFITPMLKVILRHLSILRYVAITPDMFRWSQPN